MEEEDEIQPQACKFPRLANGRTDPTNNAKIGAAWHHSSRIIRVSRASGGKDRHSKVMTSKGLRDRRVRLSVTTAIQFYDLQDRLGYDQPSKAVEWLIKSAQDAIAELPSLNTTFPETPKQPSDEKRGGAGADDADIDIEEQQKQKQNSQNMSLSKSACSSTSETSKGSGLSLSRPTSDEPAAALFHKAARQQQQQQQQQQWGSAPMDYFNQVLVGPSSSSRTHQHQHQIQLGHHTLAEAISFNNDQQQQQQHHYSFIPDQFMPAVVTSSHSHNHHHSAGDTDYNLNFTISPASVSASASGLAAYNNNRGTLQSNSPSHFLPHLQRFSLPMDGSTLPHPPLLRLLPSTTTNTISSHHPHLMAACTSTTAMEPAIPTTRANPRTHDLPATTLDSEGRVRGARRACLRACLHQNG
ncbi:hypothetical protein Ahy_A03g010235 isoform C [Arachis hypogaea]|uniref:TCP domain-containing protein n=1 Tax=Arachis hypogaea TaxID=3818 RepID=A0A445DLI0_ARAHY|nr:hypothetical protein Ahy_A03g010235 isoform C [Arachis hypogaea]